MFNSSIPTKVSKIVNEIVNSWKCKKVYIACSNDFALERAIANTCNKSLISCGIDKQSKTLGKYFSGEKINISVKSDCLEECNFIVENATTVEEMLAALMLSNIIVPYVLGDNLYCKRMVRGYKEQYKRLFDDMCKKLENIKGKIEKFEEKTVSEVIDVVGNNGMVLFIPYMSVSNKDNYMFELEDTEGKMQDEVTEELITKILKLNNFCVITDREVELLNGYESGIIDASNTLYVYSKSDVNRFVGKESKRTSAKPIVRLGKDEQVTDNISIERITLDQFNEIRALYLSTAVTSAGTPSAAYGIFSDNKLFGVFGFADSFMLSGSEKLEKPTIYLLTDFAISPTCEKNLSKLVLCCILSKEAKMLAEKVLGKRVNSITINAFSRNPVSMKYRGLFELYGRRELEKDENGKVKKYNLSYGTKMGQWTLKEGYELWRRKLSK